MSVQTWQTVLLFRRALHLRLDEQGQLQCKEVDLLAEETAQRLVPTYDSRYFVLRTIQEQLEQGSSLTQVVQRLKRSRLTESVLNHWPNQYTSPVHIALHAALDPNRRAACAAAPNCPIWLLERLSQHPDPKVRRCAAANRRLPHSCHQRLAADPAIEVVDALTFNKEVDPDLRERCMLRVAAQGSNAQRSMLSQQDQLPETVLDRLTFDPAAEVLNALASHHRLSVVQLDRIWARIGDQDVYTRLHGWMEGARKTWGRLLETGDLQVPPLDALPLLQEIADEPWPLFRAAPEGYSGQDLIAACQRAYQELAERAAKVASAIPEPSL